MIQVRPLRSKMRSDYVKKVNSSFNDFDPPVFFVDVSGELLQELPGRLVHELEGAVDAGDEDALTVAGEASAGDGIAHKVAH